MADLRNVVVGLSLSPPADLGRLGFPPREFDRLTFELAMRIIRAGGQVLYGGHLKEGSLTVAMFDHIAGAYAAGRLKKSPVEAKQTPYQRPFIHLLPASEFATTPYPRLIDTLKSFGRFVEMRLVREEHATDRLTVKSKAEEGSERTELIVTPAGADASPMVIRDQGAMREFAAVPDALSKMRRAAERLVAARIVAGGKRGDMGVPGQQDVFGGRLPGILEEGLFSFEFKHPVVWLGGFGGAARDAAIELGLLGEAERVPFLGKTQAGSSEAARSLAACRQQVKDADRDALTHFARRTDTEQLARDVVEWLAMKVATQRA